MMNATHGPSGTLAGLIAIVGARAATYVPDTPVTVAWLAGATAGALLPDADHHSSNTSKVWGPLTSIPCYFLGKLAGGHREGTHDISRGAPVLFALVFALGLLAPAGYQMTGGPTWMGIAARIAGMGVVALITGLVFVGLAALIPGNWEGNAPTNFAFSWMAAAAVTQPYPHGLPWQITTAASVGIAVGVLTGIAGDGCTISGIPWRNRRQPKPGDQARHLDKWGRDNVHLLPYAMRIRTGSAAEVFLVRAPILLGIVVLGIYVAGPTQAAYLWRFAHDLPGHEHLLALVGR